MSDSDLGKLNRYMGGTDDAAQFTDPAPGNEDKRYASLYSSDGKFQRRIAIDRETELLEVARAINGDIRFLAQSLGVTFENALEIYRLAQARMEDR